MVTSIVLTGKYNIGMNSNKKIKVDDQTLSVEKDVPFIRYRFEQYGEEEFAYINKIKQQFCNSTHLVELKACENIDEVLSQLEQNIQSVAEYIYIDVTEPEALNKHLDDSKIQLMSKASQFKIDRFMLKDKSTSLDAVAANAIIADIKKKTGIKENMVGICSSPLSFSESACLTAVKARELMSLYSPVSDMSLPSANHQCMNCCGCIRYMVVSNDLETPADSKVGVPKTKEPKANGEPKEPKEPKQPKAKAVNAFGYGCFNL